MKKITKNEFEKWSEEFRKFLDSITKAGVKNNTLTAKEINQLIDVDVLLKAHVKMGNIFAVVVGLELIKAMGVPEGERNKTFAEIDGRAFNEWENEIKQKLKDHCQAGGYYDPSKPMDLAALHEREKNIKGWWKNLDYKLKLLGCADPENKEHLSNLALFHEEGERIFPKENDEDDKQDIEKDKEWYFVLVDRVARVEKAKKALEEKEKSERDQKNPPPIPKPNKEPGDNPPPKNRESNNPKNKEDNKISWPLVLGIVVAVIGLLCFIIFIVKGRRKRGY